MSFDYRGIAVVSYNPSEYPTQESTDAINAIPATGANWISLMTTWYMENPTDNAIARFPEKTPTDEGLRKAIADAKAKGLKVMLKPQVDVKDDSWRGEINPSNNAAWFNSYRDFILTYAQIAQDTGCEIYCIGCEFKSRSGSAYFNEWTKTIDAVRQKYKGPITYAANAVASGDEFENVSFWKQLDLAGLDVYTELTTTDKPTFEQLVAAWSGNAKGLNMLATLRAFNQSVGIPVFFTEMGYQSANGCNIKPYGVDPTRRLLDLDEQALCYRAALTVWGAEPWLKGIFWWGWEVEKTYEPLRNSHYSVRGKPAQDVLASFYKSSTVVVGPTGSGILTDPAISAPGNPVKFISTTPGTTTSVMKYAWDFGDGTKSTDPEPIHNFDVAGVYTVSVTCTDLTTNVATPSQITYQVVEKLEKLKGFNFSLGLNFAKATSDSLKLTVLLPLEDPSRLFGTELKLDVGGAAQSIVLNDAGKGTSADLTCEAKVTSKPKNGKTVVAFSFKKATLANSFSDEGMTSAAVTSKIVKVSVTLQAIGTYYVGTMPLSYTSRAQKNGRAKLIKK